MSKLLINEEPLQVLPGLAKIIGLNEALVLQQIHYWLNRSDKKHEGRKWTYNSYSEWQKQFPFWSESSIKRTFQSLEKMELLITGNFNRMAIDRTKWYTINYTRLDEISPPSDQYEPMEEVKLTPPIPETTSETTSIYIEKFFKDVWALYPNKVGIGKVSKTQKDKLYKLGLTELTNCINAYMKHVELQRKTGFDLKYQNGSTFFNSGYKDYLSTNQPSKPVREPVKMGIETDYLNQ